MVKDKTCKQEVNDLIENIKVSGETFDYLQLPKVSKKGKRVKSAMYDSEKNAF